MSASERVHGREWPAESARQGEIILRHGWSRAIFLGALALAVVLAALFAFYRRAGG